VLRKKQNVRKRRPKKKETTPSLAELDLTLQNLLLDNNLEDETNDNFSESDSSGRILGEITAMAESDLNTENLMLSRDDDIENNEWIRNIRNITSNEAVSSTDKNVVIDLLSPTPIKPSNNSSKFHRSSDQNIEVINLSDSENEVSPEHKEKAKELRLFLASIRNEIH
jgi:flap endonuclease GEN